MIDFRHKESNVIKNIFSVHRFYEPDIDNGNGMQQQP